MLMSPNKDETAVLGCHCQGDMDVCMRKVVMAISIAELVVLVVCASVHNWGRLYTGYL